MNLSEDNDFSYVKNEVKSAANSVGDRKPK